MAIQHEPSCWKDANLRNLFATVMEKSLFPTKSADNKESEQNYTACKKLTHDCSRRQKILRHLS